MIILKKLLSILVLHVLWLGLVLSPVPPGHVVPQNDLASGRHPHSFSSVKSMTTSESSPNTTARTVEGADASNNGPTFLHHPDLHDSVQTHPPDAQALEAVSGPPIFTASHRAERLRLSQTAALVRH